MERPLSARKNRLLIGLAVAFTLAWVGILVTGYGFGLIAASDAMVAAAGPCNGHTACLSPGIAQPEGQTGLFYVTVESGRSSLDSRAPSLTVSIAGSFVRSGSRPPGKASSRASSASVITLEPSRNHAESSSVALSGSFRPV